MYGQACRHALSFAHCLPYPAVYPTVCIPVRPSSDPYTTQGHRILTPPPHTQMLEDWGNAAVDHITAATPLERGVSEGEQESYRCSALSSFNPLNALPLRTLLRISSHGWRVSPTR